MFIYVASKIKKKSLVKNFTLSARHLTTKFLKMPSAVVVLPPGAEEMEFVGSVDVLRRAGVSEIEQNKICTTFGKSYFNLY